MEALNKKKTMNDVIILLTVGLAAGLLSGLVGIGGGIIIVPVLVYFLGKSAGSIELKDLKANYRCEMANEAHYLSKGGIELILKNNLLNEIHLYNGSAVYGSFAGKLPNNLKFGMSAGDVKRLLGKPIVSYNSGYCEYEFANYILSCWFDGSKLNQMGVSVKTAL